MKPVISKTDPIGCNGSCARTSPTNQRPVTVRHAIPIALARRHVARTRFVATAVVISLLLLVPRRRTSIACRVCRAAARRQSGSAPFRLTCRAVAAFAVQVGPFCACDIQGRQVKCRRRRMRQSGAFAVLRDKGQSSAARNVLEKRGLLRVVSETSSRRDLNVGAIGGAYGNFAHGTCVADSVAPLGSDLCRDGVGRRAYRPWEGIGDEAIQNR